MHAHQRTLMCSKAEVLGFVSPRVGEVKELRQKPRSKVTASRACGTRQLVLSGHQRSRWGSCPVGPVMGPMAGTLFTHFVEKQHSSRKRPHLHLQDAEGGPACEALVLKGGTRTARRKTSAATTGERGAWRTHFEVPCRSPESNHSA